MTEKKVDFKMTREGLVKIENSTTKGSAEVLPESVPVWVNAGWTVVDPSTTNDGAVVVVVDDENRTGTAGPADKKK